MTLEEAQAWLRGERSTVNWAYGDTPGEAQERACRQDAAMTEQAYWIARAHAERLVPAEARRCPFVAEETGEKCRLPNGHVGTGHLVE